MQQAHQHTRFQGRLMIVLAALMLTAIGAYVLSAIPLQLAPDVRAPKLYVEAFWRSASPKEMEKAIFGPLEREMADIPGLQTMETNIAAGYGWITLYFSSLEEMKDSIVEITSRIQKIRNYPADAERPFIVQRSESDDLAMLFVRPQPGREAHIQDYLSYTEDVVIPELRKADGLRTITLLNAESLRKQIHVEVDQDALIRYRLPMDRITDTLSAANHATIGVSDIADSSYTLRILSGLEQQALEELLLEASPSRRITLGDVADVRSGHSIKRDTGYFNGALAIPLALEFDSQEDIIDTFDDLEGILTQLNDTVLADKGIEVAMSYNPARIIQNALGLLMLNVLIGVILAAVVLRYFLRGSRAMVVVLATVPVCLVATFTVLFAMDKTLNLITLSGIGLAIGIILDPSIIVLERLLQRNAGRRATDTPLDTRVPDGIRNAIALTTVTSVVIFLPIFFLDQVEGKIFGDLALSFSIAIISSALSAYFLIPFLARYLLSAEQLKPDPASLNRVRRHGVAMATRLMAHPWVGLAAVVLVLATILPALGKPDYLPVFNKGTVTSYLAFPSEYSPLLVESRVVNAIEQRVRQVNQAGERVIDDFYIRTYPGGGSMEFVPAESVSAETLLTVVNEQVLNNIQDLRTFSLQTNLFSAYGGSRNLKIYLQGDDAAKLEAAATEAMGVVGEQVSGSNVRPYPQLNNNMSSFVIQPDDYALRMAGWDRAGLVDALRVLCEGAYVNDVYDGVELIPVIVKTPECITPRSANAVNLVAPDGRIYPLTQLVDIHFTEMPRFIMKYNQRQSVVLNVSLPPETSVDAAVDRLRAPLEAKVFQWLGQSGHLTFSGSKERVDYAIGFLVRNFIFALLILFLVMALMFRSLGASALVMSVFPAAVLGGALSLKALNLLYYQPLDIVTLMGFVVVLGIVANSAIVLVQEFLEARRDASPESAMVRALEGRFRPVMTMLVTTVFGMLPMIVFPGEASVMYRGLATVVAGGVVLGTVFSLLVLPTLIILVFNPERRLWSLHRGRPNPVESTP